MNKNNRRQFTVQNQIAKPKKEEEEETRNLQMPQEMDSPSSIRRDGHEICPSTVYEMGQHVGPIVSNIPRDLCRRIDFYRHHLGNTSALDDDYESADSAVVPASFFASLNIIEDQGVSDVLS